MPPPPPGEPDRPRQRGPIWDSSGWVLLGEKSVRGTEDKDAIRVSQRGQYSALTIVAEDGDFEMVDVVVTFDNDRKFSPNVKHGFREGQRTRAIDLPGEARSIKSIDVVTSQVGSPARVQVWGRAGDPRTRRAAEPSWNTRGWSLLGEEVAENTNDKDSLEVGGGQVYKSLTFWAVEELQIGKVVVTFANGRTWSPNVKGMWRADEHRSVDLPDGGKAIKQIDIEHSRPEGAGNARLQVWGKS